MQFEGGQVLVLSGSPGSGKSTAAKAISSLAGSPKVHLHTDDFWGFVKHGYVDPWRPEAAGQNRTVMDVAAAAAERYALGGYFVIVDGVVGPWFIDAFAAIAARTYYLVLRTSREEAIRRCQQRGGTTLSDPAVVGELYDQFADLGRFEPNALDVGSLSLDEVITVISKAMTTGRNTL